MSYFARAALAAAALACAPFSYAVPALSTIQDTLYKADGTRFNGTVTVTWNSFLTGDQAPVGAQGTTLQIVNGALRVQLAPTTTATPGTNYTVVYSSQGKFQFSETWAVPPSTSVLRIRDVRVSTGDVIGPPPVTTAVDISDVTGLTNELAARAVKGPAFAPSRAAVINALGAIDAASGNPGDCVRVDGTSGACGTSGNGGPLPSFSDNEVPSGLVNGANTAFTLMYAPSPDSSLLLFRNGLRMTKGVDYTTSGNTITFLTVSTPQAGDVISASYRYGAAAGSSSSSIPQVICSSAGQGTRSMTATVLGTCNIPSGTLASGDRVEIRFDYSHEGTASAFTAQVAWGASTLVTRSGSSADIVIAGRADAIATISGTQWSGSSWGSVTAFAVSAGITSDNFAGPLTVTFSGQMNAAGTDTVTLRNYAVIRYPAVSN
jgi:hypothetical protein